MAPPAPPPAKGDKKSAPNTAGVITSPSKTAQTPSHMYSAAPSPVINSHLSNVMSVSICPSLEASIYIEHPGKFISIG